MFHILRIFFVTVILYYNYLDKSRSIGFSPVYWRRIDLYCPTITSSFWVCFYASHRVPKNIKLKLPKVKKKH